MAVRGGIVRRVTGRGQLGPRDQRAELGHRGCRARQVGLQAIEMPQDELVTLGSSSPTSWSCLSVLRLRCVAREKSPIVTRGFTPRVSTLPLPEGQAGILTARPQHGCG